VADGAVVGDAGKADGLLGEADRQFLALFPRDPKRRIAAGDDLAVLDEFLGEDAG
jgi:hypothetical protein